MRRVMLVGPDGRSCEINHAAPQFWDWLLSYCEESRSASVIAGLRWRWVVGLFAVDPHVGGISRAQFGRAVGRHPGHAGREIDGDSPSLSAQALIAANFKTEIKDDGIDDEDDAD